ncbi:hypothetical protein [Micromonospora marina]|uniref:hypothetical protein n=1 Tax=Micromonospora marina TaxID=307120 RepID=UPI003455EF61
MLSGLDEAEKISSVVGAVVAVIALIVTIRAARRQPAVDAASYPGHGTSTLRRSSGRATTPIALIIILAVVVLCVVPSWGIVYAVTKFSGDGAAGGRSASPATSDPGRPATALPGSPIADVALWKGEIRLDSTPRDFDQEPPARGNMSTDLGSDGYLNGSVYTRFWGRAVVLWPGRTGPSRADCAGRLQTHGVRTVSVDIRSRVCLETNQGRIVFIKVLRRDGDDGYAAEVTIWSSS